MKIDISNSTAGCVIRLAGELDHHAAKVAITEIGAYLDNAIPQRVTFDLDKLSFMDSSGIALVLHAYRKVSDVGGNVMLTHVPQAAARVFGAAGIKKLMQMDLKE